MITDKKEKELYEKIDKKLWIYDYGEYRLHHSAAETLIDIAESLKLAIVGIEGYKWRGGEDFIQVNEYTYDFDDYNEIETWEEKFRQSIEVHRRVIREFLGPKLKPEDEIYLTFYFDERGDLKLVK
jgi:hypothetical protein